MYIKYYQECKGTHLFKFVDPFLYMYERSHIIIFMCYIHIVYVVKEMTSFCGLGHLMGVAYIIISLKLSSYYSFLYYTGTSIN